VLLTGYRAAAPGHRLRSTALALLAFPLYAIGAVVTGRPELSYGVPTLAVAAFLAGQVASELRAASERREAQARAEAELRLLTEERLRIARELQDVISHGIATIGVQAGVAAHVINEHPELLDKVASAVATVNGRVQDILNLLTDQGFVLEDVGPENYQTDVPVSPEVEEKVRSIFDLLRSVGPETVKGLPPVADVFATGEGGRSDLSGCVGTAERHPQRTSGWGVERPQRCDQLDACDNNTQGFGCSLRFSAGTGRHRQSSCRDPAGIVGESPRIGRPDLRHLAGLSGSLGREERGFSNSPVWISADAVLTARGVRPKRYETEGKRWAHGHRTEDRIAVGQALAQLDAAPAAWRERLAAIPAHRHPADWLWQRWLGKTLPLPRRGLLERDWQKALVVLLTLLAGIAVLWQVLSPILHTLILFALAAVLAFAPSGLVDMLTHHRWQPAGRYCGGLSRGVLAGAIKG
jgi:Histidine kinase